MNDWWVNVPVAQIIVRVIKYQKLEGWQLFHLNPFSTSEYNQETFWDSSKKFNSSLELSKTSKNGPLKIEDDNE